jgi:beta-glucosidase
MSLRFPKNFLWGAATSSYQVEGGIHNNDWADAAKENKVPVADLACDHYRLYEKDFDLAKILSHNAHRFSLEWARIEPTEGHFDEKEIEHYRRVIRTLRERKIEPVITLWHFTLPLWFSKKGGFLNKNAPFLFARYCEYVVSQLGEDVTIWVTINEPEIWADQGYLRGNWPPFKHSFFKYFKASNNLISAHTLAYQKMKSVKADFQIGVAKNNVSIESNWNPMNKLLVVFLKWFRNAYFLRGINGAYDFIGLNYYFHKVFGGKEQYKKSDLSWDIEPRGIYDCLTELKKYHKPIYITENGLADKHDLMREDFIRDHLKWVHEAIHKGADVRGYFHWSLLDNFEWAHGYEPRFGLIEVNYETLERKIRPSAYVYKELIDNSV